MADETTIEVPLTAGEAERLRAVADEPADLLYEAGLRRLRLEETIEATFEAQGERPGPALDDDGRTPLAPVGVTVGFEIEAVGDGEATAVLEAGREHANPLGTLHGGVLCDLGDAAMGSAFASTLGVDETFTTPRARRQLPPAGLAGPADGRGPRGPPGASGGARRVRRRGRRRPARRPALEHLPHAAGRGGGRAVRARGSPKTP